MEKTNISEIEFKIKKIKENNPGKKIVTTNGCFDLIHSGHLYSLEKAKSFGDILIVCLNSDSSIKRIKGESRPIINQQERIKLMLSLKPVDHVFVFEEDNPSLILDIIKPDFHVKSKKGFSNHLYTVGPEGKIIEKNGGKVILIDDLNNINSTTDIINKIKNLG